MMSQMWKNVFVLCFMVLIMYYCGCKYKENSNITDIELNNKLLLYLSSLVNRDGHTKSNQILWSRNATELNQKRLSSGHFSATDFMNTWDLFRKIFVADLKFLLRENIKEDDPRLLELIRKNMFPPQKHAKPKLSFYMPTTLQEITTKELFKNKRGGFFVECGGFDGERSSNTIGLEKLGWNGLLIEADPFFFFQSLGKNRRAWKLNAAINFSGRTAIVTFKESFGGRGVLGNGSKLEVASFPLSTIMAAMKQKKIDFFSLDVEGVETKILKSLRYDLIEICALTMEYNHDPEKPQDIIKMMDKFGFKLHKKLHFVDVKITHFTHDLFFVNKKSCS